MINTLSDLDKLIGTSSKLIFVETVEETRIIQHLETLAKERQVPFYTWDAADALVCVTHVQEVPKFDSLRATLHHIKSDIKEGFIAILDPSSYLEDPAVERLLKEIGDQQLTKQRTVLIGPANCVRAPN